MSKTYFEKETAVQDVEVTEEYAYVDPVPRSKRIMKAVLDETSGIVCGSRHDSYGSPDINHARTAKMWSVFLGITVTPRQVCYMNILQKCSREVHESQKDNDVDICGYAANAAACQAIYADES